MIRIIISNVLLFLTLTAYSQSLFRDFISAVDTCNNTAERNEVISGFLPLFQSQGIPFIEGDTACFIYSGDASLVLLAGDFNGWNTDTMIHIDSTFFFYHRQLFEPTARLDYKLIVDNNWMLDPMNPNTCSGGFGPNSELAMPLYVQPWEIIAYPETDKGSLSTISFQSVIMNKKYQVQIYLPPGYDASGNVSYPSLYVHDGHEYLSLADMRNILDNLLDSNFIDPLIGIFIKPSNRNEEYGFTQRNQYSDFITGELVPYIDSHYPTIKSPEFRLTMGTSLGGNISGLISYGHPEVFGNCGLHSPAFWVNDFEVARWFTDSLKKDVNLFYIAGTYEDLGIDWSEFNDSLDSKGYQFRGKLFYEGHSWGLWRANCDEILKFFFPKGSVPLGYMDIIPDNHILGHVYPNPFSCTALIPISVKIPGNYSLRQYTSSGQLVNLIAEGFLEPGDYQFPIEGEMLDPGYYICTLVTPVGVFNRSMLVVK